MDELLRELKREGVLRSPYVEAAFRAIDRKDFVQPEHRGEAYANYPLPIGRGQTISQPYTVAFMLDLLDPKPGEKILDVGAGSGWQTALVAHIVSHQRGEQRATPRKHTSGLVVAVERIPELFTFGRANVAKYNFISTGTVKFLSTDATAGCPEEAPFDKIIAAAATSHNIPPAWREELKVGGVIVAPVGGSIWRYTKESKTRWREEEFPGFAFVPLVQSGGRKQGTGGGKNGNDRTDEGESTSGKNRNREHHRPVAPLTLFSIFFLLLIISYAAFAPVRLPPAGIEIEVPPGAGVREIARLLASQGIIRSRALFAAYALLAGAADDLKPGSYEFSGWVTTPEALGAIVRGGRDSREVVITVPEGWNLHDIAAYLERLGLARREEFFAAAGAPREPFRSRESSATLLAFASKPPAANLEGFLYPDTYRVFRASPVEEIVEKMLERFARQLTPQLRAEIAERGRTVFEVITLASLIEEEVADRRERRIVSGILWKRLGAGIPLQVDATVNYVTGKRETPLAQDLELDSPYNTYRTAGLPPGPIANPGMDAILAAIRPEPSEYLYYLSAPDGHAVFSRTLAEHAAAKVRYLR